MELGPGQTREVVLKMERAARVRGVVREKGTQRPIEGVRIGVAIFETGSMTTGADGSYQGFMEPGGTFVSLRSVPPGYAMPLYGLRPSQIPEGAAEFSLPPVELMRAAEVRGKVVDDRSRPVVGAEVEASWTLDETGEGTGPIASRCAPVRAAVSPSRECQKGPSSSCRHDTAGSARSSRGPPPPARR